MIAKPHANRHEEARSRSSRWKWAGRTREDDQVLLVLEGTLEGEIGGGNALAGGRRFIIIR